MALEKSPFYFFTVSFKPGTDHNTDPLIHRPLAVPAGYAVA